MITFPLAKPDINSDDINAVTQVLKSQYLSRGPVVDEFEKEFCKITQSKFASAVSSGTAGLIMALNALDVKQGDEVITVSFTVPATVNSIVAVGAKPILVDIDEETLGMCPKALSAAITNKTKAIIIVHAFGKSAKIHKLLDIAKKYRIKVIEDACEAIGNCYDDKPLGTYADIGVFAFYPNKQITSGEGGMLVTNNESLYRSFELLKNHGRSMNGDLYDQMSFGWNFRLSDINAALGLSQLRRLKVIMEKRQKIACIYDQKFDGMKAIKGPKFSSSEKNSAWFVYVVRLFNKNRNDVMKQLEAKGIQCGRYFAPVHLQPYYLNKLKDLSLVKTEKLAEQCLALPFYTQLKTDDVGFICDNLLKSTT